MKQKLDIRQYFNDLDEESKFKLLHETQLTVQRLERIIGELVTWKEGSYFYQEAYQEFLDYIGE